MKNKIIYLFMVLFLVSCGSSTTSSLAPDNSREVSAPKVTVQSILSAMDKGRYKEKELLVKFKSGVVSASSLRTHQAIGATSLKRYTLVHGLEHVKLPAGLSVRDAVSKYMSDPAVEYAEPNYVKCLSSVIPSDTFFEPQQWALLNTGQFAGGTAGADIKAPGAWGISFGQPAVTIAVLDSGIDYNHPDLVNNIWTNPGESCNDGIDHDNNGFVNDCRGWNFVDDTNDPMDDMGHGTHVAGIIGAKGNNQMGTTGVMWTARLMPLKIFDVNSVVTGSCVSAFVSDEIAAIQYAVDKKVQVINASFRSEGFCYSEFDAIGAAGNSGVLFVAAAGNGGLDTIGVNNDLDPQYPASYNLGNITSVAATDQNDRLASFSNFGPNSVHVAAPGVYVLSTMPYAGVALSFQSLCTGSFFAGYDFCSGTSMAAPHVSGLAGLLFSYYDGSHNTQFDYSQVRGTLLRYVDIYVDSPNLLTLKDKIMTSGRINAYKALSSLLAPTGLTATAVSPTQITLTWTDNATGEDGYRLEKKGPTDTAFVDITAASPLPPGTTTFNDSGVSKTKTYQYRVRAFNNIANSFYSNTISVTTPDDPPPPSTGGGGGCSIGARQNTPTAIADLAVLLMPLLLIAVLRRKR